MKFNPNALTYDEGIERIHAALKAARVRLGNEIVTSRNPRVRKVMDSLRVKNIPNGFKKWQLPVYLDSPSQMYLSIGAPDTVVPRHSHQEGDGIRVIIGGSIIYNRVELTEGDWMFIPKGKPYDFKVGPGGASMFYCYCCSCA